MKNKDKNKIKEPVENMNDEIDTELEQKYPYKWVDEFNMIDLGDIRKAQVSHNGTGEYVALFYSKTNKDDIMEIHNKYFETIEDVRLFIWAMLMTDYIDVFDYNYMKEHPEEFE